MTVPQEVRDEYTCALEQFRREVREGTPSVQTVRRRIAAIRVMHDAIAPDDPCPCPVCRDRTSVSRETGMNP